MKKIIHISSKPMMKSAAQYCVDNSLFMPMWSLETWYSREIQKGDYITNIFIYKKNDVPLGALVIRNKKKCLYDSHNSGLIVKEPYRRQGIGTKLVQKCIEDGVELIPWRYGIESRPFYDKVMPLPYVEINRRVFGDVRP